MCVPSLDTHHLHLAFFLDEVRDHLDDAVDVLLIGTAGGSHACLCRLQVSGSRSQAGRDGGRHSSTYPRRMCPHYRLLLQLMLLLSYYDNLTCRSMVMVSLTIGSVSTDR